MKKILIFSLFFYPSIGGVQSTSRTLAKALVRLGYEVTLITGTKLINSEKELNEDYKIVRSLNWLRLIYLCYQSELIIIKGGVSVLAGMAAWLTHTPYLFYHEMLGSYLYANKTLKAIVSNPLRQRLVADAIAHIGVTRSCLDSKQIASDKPQFAIYNPVSPELQAIAEVQTNDNREPDYDILFVGRLLEAKGIYVLADALKLFESAQMTLRACFVGPGDGLKLEQYLQDCSTVKVSFLGPLEGKALAEAYASSRLLVIPSSTHPEGMGLVIAEAFMFDLPVIGSSQPAIREVIANDGLIFENGSAKELYEKLQEILFDSEIYQKYQNHVLQQKQKFTYSGYLAAIQSCLTIINHNSRN
jgi:glycosyltransferase involved in cell wall biosynthesis